MNQETSKLYAIVSIRGFYGEDDRLAIESLHDNLDNAIEAGDGYGPDWDHERKCTVLAHNQSSGAVLELWEVLAVPEPEDEDDVYLEKDGIWYKLVNFLDYGEER